MTSLLGMTAGTIPSVAELHDTRRLLRRDVVERMSPQAKEFLTSFFELSPTWDALSFDGLERLPALSGNCTTWKSSGADAAQTSSDRTTNSRRSSPRAVDD